MKIQMRLANLLKWKIQSFQFFQEELAEVERH